MWKPVKKKKKYAEIIVDGVCDHCGHRALTARIDDGEESIKKRIHIYHEVTEPLENYDAVKGLLLRVVDAGQPAAVVTEQLKKLLSAEGLLPVSVRSIQKDIESDKLVYIDESGIEMGICRDREWCQKEEKLIGERVASSISTHI
jgi:hypothetical protein